MPTITNTSKKRFKIGDTVYLRDYNLYNDYKIHNDQTAIINSNVSGIFDYKIKWNDGSSSCVKTENIFSFNNNSLLNKKVVCIEGYSKGSEGIIKRVGKNNGRGKDTSIWSDWGKPNDPLTYLDLSILKIE